MSPAINYAKDLVADGYVGRVLTATMIGCAPNWGATIDRAYQADRANGANLLTITGGHQIDALCYCLGEFRELAAFAVSQRDRIPVESTGEVVPKTVPDQLVVNGIVGDGAVVSFQIRGGMTRGTAFLFEIHGDNGDLTLTATTRDSMQRQELTVRGAQGGARDLTELSIPAKYRWIPDGTPTDSRYNVAQLYARLAESIREGGPATPGLMLLWPGIDCLTRLLWRPRAAESKFFKGAAARSAEGSCAGDPNRNWSWALLVHAGALRLSTAGVSASSCTAR